MYPIILSNIVEQVDGLKMELIDDEDESPKVDPTMLESMMGYINS